MSYTPRFGEYIYAKDTFENTDTRWIIAEFEATAINCNPKSIYKYYIDNFGNVIGELIKDPSRKDIEVKGKERLKHYEPVTEQYDIPLSDDLIITIKFHPLMRNDNRYVVRDIYCLPTAISILNLVKSIATSHYKNYQELQALKQRVQTLEATLSNPPTQSEDLLDLTLPTSVTPTADLLDLSEPAPVVETISTHTTISDISASIQDLLQFIPSDSENTTSATDTAAKSEPRIVTDPRKLGFELEELIHTAITALSPSYIVRREQDIRTHFSDQSLNGVDHWITKGGNHYMIQTKWRETTTQPEVTQFLTCVDRIQARFKDNEKVFLIWVCKYPPTKHALVTLNERKVQIISCNLSIQALARNVIDYIASLSFEDPTPAYKVIPIGASVAEETQAASFTVASPPPIIAISRPAKIEFDDTDEGKALRIDMEKFIETNLIHNIHRLMRNSQYTSHSSNSVIVDTAFPKALKEWTSGQRRKVDFNKLLRDLKSVNYPTSKEPTQLMFLEMYCKMRYISTLLADISLNYTAKYNTLVTKKST